MKSDSRLLALSVLVLVATAVQAFDDETVSDELLEIFQDSPVDDNAGGISGADRAIQKDNLTLNIKRVRNDKGTVIVLIYDDPDAYAAGDYQQAVGFDEVEAAPGTVQIEFPYLTDGPYAVFVYHDENADSKFAMTAGYPEEGYGYSNSYGAFEAPKFDTAAVSPGPVEIRMHYLPPRSTWQAPSRHMRR